MDLDPGMHDPRTSLAALLLALVAPLVAAQAAAESAARAGERCVACGSELGADDVALRAGARRVALCAGACADAFRADPQAFLAGLRTGSALFQEPAEPRAAVASPWFWLGVWVVLGLVSSAAAAYVAVDRGQPPLGWFFAGLVGNVAALAVLAFAIPRGASRAPKGLAKVPSTRAARPCTACGAALHPAASVCPACGAALEPLVPSEVRRSGAEE